jgi:fibronectin type 3 domain-containing protein
MNLIPLILTAIAPHVASIRTLPGYVALQWEAQPGMSYTVYSGHRHNSYEYRKDCGTNAGAEVSCPFGETRYFAVTATDTNGVESDLSSEFGPFTAAPVLEMNFDFTGTSLQSSADLSVWWNRLDAKLTPTGWRVLRNPNVNQEFYRVAP